MRYKYWGWAPPTPPPASLMSLVGDFVWGQPPPPPPTLTNEEGLAITVVVALICILAAVIMGCGASSPPGAKYAESPPIKGDDLIKSYTERIRESDLRKAQWDTFVSAAPAETALAKRVRDHLRAAGYKIPNPRKEPDAQKQGIRDSRRVVSFISQTYFDSPACCAEFCEAVINGVEVLPVSVEGSSWRGMPFPALTDVPETAQTDEGRLVKPRDAAAAVFGHTIALDHMDAYLDAFLENLGKRLGGPGEASSAGRRPRETSTDFLLGERTIRYDAFLSHKRSEAQDIVARVHDRLSDFGYRAFIDRNDLIELPSLKLAVRDTQTLVVFLTPAYFASAWCCLEFVEAVRHGVTILFIHVDGSTWGANGAQFPSLSDVPVTIKVEDVTIRVREAAAKVFPPAQLVEHTRSYFNPFVDALCKKLGPPPAISSIEGEARGVWSAAGGGATVSWATLKASLAQACGSSFGSVESTIAKALGVRDALGDAGAMVTATTFATLFAQTSVKATVEAMIALSGGADAEQCVPVIVDEAGDGGLALVGGATTFADVRKQIIEANEEDEDEGEEDESAVRKALATGQFTFQVKGRAVKRKQETLIKGREVGDPIQVVTKSGDKAAVSAPGTPEASAVDSAAAAAAAAAASILSQSQRRDADALTLESILRDHDQSKSLRRHASLLGKQSGGLAAADKAERAFLISKALRTLEDALTGLNGGAALAASNDLKAYASMDAAYGLLPNAPGIGASAGAMEVAAAFKADRPHVEALLLSAVEAMRTEMYKAAAGTAIKREKQSADVTTKKRVVILGGGPCGVIVAHQMTRGKGIQTEAFHVTLVDTKEFFEYTPNVLRLIADENAEQAGLWDLSCYNHVDVMGGKGELIIGWASAVRKDHVLVGTSSGVASRVLPYDYLVICTGTSYTSDIKTEGTSIAARKQSFALERQRIKDAPAITVVGGGVVGCELAFDIKAFFPDKAVEIITRGPQCLPRVPGASALVKACADEDGIAVNYSKDVTHVDESGRPVTKDGVTVGAPNARIFWATGNKPNNQLLTDPRSDSAFASVMDDQGFIKTKNTQQLNHPNLGHIYAGGDICAKDRFTAGERTMGEAGAHAFAILKNIQVAAGVRPGALQQPQINKNPGLGTMIISLGNKRGALFATDPKMSAYFATKDKLLEEVGPMAEQGAKGWIEVSPRVDLIKFQLAPRGYRNGFLNDDMSSWEQFFGPDQANKVEDA